MYMIASGPGQTYSKLLSVSNTTAIVTSTSNDAYKVPPEVLMTATQVQNVTVPLHLRWNSTKSATVWSIYFHFVELQLQENDIREVTVNVQEFREKVILENLKPVTVASSPIAGLSLDMTIEATARSTLPPLLNAVEIFTVAQLPNSPTLLDDFNAMYDVKKIYGVVRASWQGDPCVPTQYSWSGLNCRYDSSPRIVSLNLSSSGLKGLIATSISNLTAVVSLDLSNNSLIGSIPDFLAQMPSLKILDLGGNNLNGSVPQTLLKKKADGSLQLRTVIGEGGFGKVYFGKLDDGTEVAVKMLSHSSKQGYKEFHTEAQLLMVVHHRNLISLIGYCEEFESMALIYEFMFNGNVQQHLSAQNPNVLSWSQRLQIAIDAAQGLEYLHNGCKPPIVHRDLKTPNILLNKDMQAKIADFGVSKAFVTEHDSHISTRPSGTPGYLDPEFHTSGNLSRKSDVYSFGVILFELITGHPAIIRSPEGSTHILHWVTPLIERGDIQSIVDPRLNGQFNIGSAWNAVEIALLCVPTTAVQRPDINRVLWELKECLTAEIRSGRSQRMGNSKRSESFEMTSLDVDIAPKHIKVTGRHGTEATRAKLVEAAMSRVAMTANERPNMNPHAVGAEGMLDSFWARYGPFGEEVSRVLGGGLVPGSLILVGGDPGVGKSTLLLQSVEQIGSRADRLSIGTEELYLYSSTDIEDILEKIQVLSPGALIINSIQTVYLKGVAGSAGGLSQIGHVTKSGEIVCPYIFSILVILELL
ncbi:hypothetical protein NL676_006726 [Syzygium grande]|nr:hypothetical protein NL676_006726 [Syzygium grande]